MDKIKKVSAYILFNYWIVLLVMIMVLIKTVVS